MLTNELLSKYDNIISDISTKLAEIVLADLNNPAYKISFCLNEGIEQVKDKLDGLPNNAGLYFFEIGLKKLYEKEMELDDWDIQKGKTLFSIKRKHFYDFFNGLWNAPDKRYESTYPKIIRGRFFKYHYRKRPYRNSFETEDWVPFYLGTSKDILKRVNEHIDCKQSKYSSMKLSHFLGENGSENLIFCDLPIRVSVSEIPDIDKDRRYILVTEVERILRETLHPLVGKQ